MATSPHELSRAFAAAINDGDLGAAVAMWADDATIVAADGNALAGRDAVAGALRALIDSGATVSIEVASMYQGGKVAIATGSLTLLAPDGTSHTSSSVVVYERSNEGWRLAIDAPWGLPSSNGTPPT